jgi:hypothetical protein
MSKAIMSMANSNSENQGPIDFDQYFKESPMFDNLLNLNIGSSLEKVDNTLDYGYLLKVKISKDNKSDIEENGFFPKRNGKSIVIDLGDLKISTSNDQSNEMGMALLSTAKYRLLLSKKYCNTIKSIQLINNENDESTDCNYVDLDDEYLIEIPLITFLFTNTKILINI